MTPAERLHARTAYGQAVDAFDALQPRPAPQAWRPRTDPQQVMYRPQLWREAHVSRSHAAPARHFWDDMPGWFHVVAGGSVAALVGALLGGFLHV